MDTSRDCVEGQDRCAAAIAAESIEPPVAAVIATKVAAGSGRREETRPALKAAAADPAGTFTAATAEAGEEDDDEELPPALKAAAADLTGSFTAAAAEAGGDDEEEELQNSSGRNKGRTGCGTARSAAAQTARRPG